jgi:light-independent protochlorophyllide reductase subunit B
MFRGDFEFHDDAAPSHLGGGSENKPVTPAAPVRPAEDLTAATTTPAETTSMETALHWSSDAEQELRKIPFFVRGKARRNTERFAGERGVTTITIETLYDAKAHFGR